ncbi:MAG: CopD family protein [Hydrogenophilus sp.]|nr:CopD family protein [Hydrogenophilus sp.]
MVEVVKSFHIVFVTAWFAGLFYLPRIFVNLAMERHEIARARLLGMAERLFRFMSVLGVLAIGLGLWLWFGFGFSGGWLHAKTVLVAGLAGYHFYCGVILERFKKGVEQRSHRWFRVFNEVPLIVLTAVVFLVELKPF